MAELSEKAPRYGRMLADAVDAVEVVDSSKEADEFLRQAGAELEDGRHFLDQGGAANPPAAFPYGPAATHARERRGLDQTHPDHKELFAA